jgi:4-carboxymuconolactone decarboxylase
MGRSSLDTRTQEIVAITTFATLGATAAPILKFRIATALRAGVTREEIIDIFIQISLGAGLPTALAAIKMAEATFAESMASEP